MERGCQGLARDTGFAGAAARRLYPVLAGSVVLPAGPSFVVAGGGFSGFGVFTGRL
jgi:hypothetical protein